MFVGIDYAEAAQERHNDLLQQAEQARFARKLSGHRSQTRHWTSVALIWLGHQFSSWGHHLQQRHTAYEG